MIFKKVFAAAASALAIAAFAGNAMARDTLRIGTEPTFAPFEFLDTKTQEFSGFDIDLIKAVADKAGYDVKVMNMGFDALIPALSAGTIDVMLLASPSPKNVRRRLTSPRPTTSPASPT